jgi:hypothetical protein
MALLLLIAASAISFCSPCVGIICLLVLHNSLFNLDRFATLSFATGYLTPMDVMIPALVLGVFSQSLVKRNDKHVVHNDGRLIRATFLSAVAPFCVWQCVGLGGGLLWNIWSMSVFTKLAVRYLLSGVLLWVLVWVILQLGAKQRILLAAVIVVANVTAVLHIWIVLFDHRSLVPAAYWNLSEENSFLMPSYQWNLRMSDLFRAHPTGIWLMLYSAVFSFAEILNARRLTWRIFWMGLTLAIQTIALASTGTRSLAASMIAGVLAAIFLSAWGLRGARLVFCLGVLVIVGWGSWIAASQFPALLGTWKSRMQRIDSDSQVFSPETDRGLDNLAALAAITDRPLLGVGAPRYPGEYSFRLVPPTDIHPLLAVGLVSGIPGMLLALRLHWVVITRMRAWYRRSIRLAENLVPYVCVIVVSLFGLVLGGFATFDGPALLSIVVFFGLLGARAEQLAEERARQ